MFNIFNLFNNKKNNVETNQNARQLGDLELIPTFKFNQDVEDEFERIKNRLLLGEKLIVVNDEDCSQQFFFNDGKDYLDESHDFFCNRVAILEVKSDEEIIVNDIPSLNSIETFYQFKTKNNYSTTRWLKLTKNKHRVDFKAIKSIRVALLGNDVNYPERVFLASDLPLLKKSLQKKLSTYENDIKTIEKLKSGQIKSGQKLPFSEVIFSEAKEINEFIGNLSSMLEISYNIKNKETEFNYCSNRSLLDFLNTEKEYDKLLNIINSLLKKELSIEFSSFPVFSLKNNNKYYSSSEEFKHNRVEELKIIIQNFLINIQDPNSAIFHYSQLYSKKELRKLEKMSHNDFDCIFKDNSNTLYSNEKKISLLRNTNLILNLKSIHMVDLSNRSKITKLKITSNCLKIENNGKAIIYLNCLYNDNENIEVKIIDREFESNRPNINFYFTREQAIENSIEIIKTKRKELLETIKELDSLKI